MRGTLAKPGANSLDWDQISTQKSASGKGQPCTGNSLWEVARALS